jgi:hypothetical protein
MSGTGLLEAVLAVQQEAPTLPKDKTNPHFGSKYTPLDTIVETIGPLLSKHGLVWVTLPSGTHDEPTLKYRLAHAATKESLEGEMPLLLDKSSAQAMGSALTYTRRYSLCAVLNLVADDDDDGHAAGTAGRGGRAGRPSDAQKGLIERLVKQKGATVHQLNVMLEQIGAQGVTVKEGWLDLLTGGREGTASALINWLKDGELPPKPEPSAPASDVPEPADDEFRHPEEKPMELLG